MEQIIDSSNGCSFSKTHNLRYVKKKIYENGIDCKYELRLQQMWQGSDGSIKWEWVEEVDL
jgi:hypothetical protein